MNETLFVERREPDWKRLHHLCNRADASPANLSAAEFHEFVRLYRRVSTDLAAVRTKTTNEGLADFLNDLVARAYGILYRSPRKSIGAAIKDAVAASARTVRRCRYFVLASAALFVGSGVFAFYLMRHVPDARSQ